MPTTTSRLGMEVMSGSDLVSTIDTTDAQAKAIIDTLGVDAQGTHASRPAANTVPRGYWYYETDTGRHTRSDGSAWHTVLPGTGDVSTAMLADASVTTAKIADANVTIAKLATSLQAQIPTLVTSLPGSPTDGQVVHYLVDSSNGIIWQVRYRSASGSSHKWEFVGGSPLISTDNHSGAMSNTSYTTFSLGAPSISVPVAGDYDVTTTVQGGTGFGENTATLLCAPDGASVTASDANAAAVHEANSNSAKSSFTARLGLTAATLSTKVKVTANEQDVFQQQLIVRPVRIG